MALATSPAWKPYTIRWQSVALAIPNVIVEFLSPSRGNSRRRPLPPLFPGGQMKMVLSGCWRWGVFWSPDCTFAAKARSQFGEEHRRTAQNFSQGRSSSSRSLLNRGSQYLTSFF
ncbi:hypothetical protein DEV91_14714 [Phyllobacterium brassicacearum]|nr:hypothetical protein DEV91_14714 [Phyllobacterium brassicacearum]